MKAASANRPRLDTNEEDDDNEPVKQATIES